MIERSRVREALTGPVSSIRPPFHRDGRIDYDGLRSVIDFNISAGSKTMLLTAGDSHYIALSDQEIAEISRAVVEHTAGRAMVVTADRYFGTPQAVAFALHVARLGADVLMVLPPDWAASCTPETLAAHYAEISRHIPVMVVTGIFSSRGEAFGLRTLELALDRAENLVAVKDDICGDFARKMVMLVYDRCAVFSGGQKQNHMNAHPYGCHGYLSTFITFKPEVAHRYWSAIQANDLPAAVSVIRDLDLPFFDLISAVPGGFDAGLHGVLELFGICKRWRRPPYYSLSDADMETLAHQLRRIGIL